MVLAHFLPQNEHFFDYFHDAVSNAEDVARALDDLFEHYVEVEGKVRRVRDLERKGDDIIHQIFNVLNRTFVTPLDREDIADLASRIDDFVDAIEEAVRRTWLYHIDEPTEYARLLAHIISKQAVLIGKTMPLLQNRREWDQLRQCSIEINRLEGEADDVMDKALMGLFDGAADISSLIKAIRWREIYQYLEDAADYAEDVADTLERIVVKNA